MRAPTGTQPRILAIDTGGTMTDTILVGQDGRFTIGKAQTTPEDESRGVLRSLEDALHYRGLPIEEGARLLQAVIYSGTTVLNKVLTRSGEGPIGVLVPAGFEDLLRMGRGVQSYVGGSFAERLHAVSHAFDPPLVPRAFIRGVRGRVNVWGEEIAREEMARRGREVPVYRASRYNPVRGDLPRLNTLILEPYAAAASRPQLLHLREQLEQRGSKAPLRLLTCHGGTIPPESEWLAPTLVSGPVGGVIGARSLSQVLGLPNLVCSDVGGTSFDAGLITEGEYAVEIEPAIARLKLSIPCVSLTSIGAGTGTFVRLDRVTGRVELGPDSAGWRIGACWAEGGLEEPTINDCNLLLGILDPDNFLGGQVRLDPKRAERFFTERIAAPLGLTAEEAAWGIVKLIETQMRDHLNALILGRGYAPENYVLLSYGGGGPLHVAGYASGLGFQDVLVPSWAPAFSAFGCACADYSFRQDRQVDLPLKPDFSNAEMVVGFLNAALAWTEERVHEEVQHALGEPKKRGFRFEPRARLQYLGMLDDLEVPVPRMPLDVEGLREVVRRYEDLFGKVFAPGAQTPEAGYLVTRAVGVGTIPTEQPRLQKEKTSGPRPPASAGRGLRGVYWEGRRVPTRVWALEELLPGNVLEGPALLEAPATTLWVPPALEARLDPHRVFHLSAVRGPAAKKNPRRKAR